MPRYAVANNTVTRSRGFNLNFVQIATATAKMVQKLVNYKECQTGKANNDLHCRFCRKERDALNMMQCVAPCFLTFTYL